MLLCVRASRLCRNPGPPIMHHFESNSFIFGTAVGMQRAKCVGLAFREKQVFLLFLTQNLFVTTLQVVISPYKGGGGAAAVEEGQKKVSGEFRSV